MIPATPAPGDGQVRGSVDFKLKTRWRFEPKPRAFVSASGREFKPISELPKRTRIVQTTPALMKRDKSELNRYEKELLRYMQVILPPGETADGYVEMVRAWPCVEEAHATPQVSLPTIG